MAIEEAKKYLAEKGYEDRVMELDHSSATVAEAAEALGGKTDCKNLILSGEGHSDPDRGGRRCESR